MCSAKPKLGLQKQHQNCHHGIEPEPFTHIGESSWN